MYAMTGLVKGQSEKGAVDKLFTCLAFIQPPCRSSTLFLIMNDIKLNDFTAQDKRRTGEGF